MVRRISFLVVTFLFAAPAVALAAATLLPDPRSVSFGSRCVQTTSRSSTVRVTNTGPQTASKISIAVLPESAEASFRLKTNVIPNELPKGASLRFSVAFTPVHEGPAEGRVVVRYSSGQPASSATPSPSPRATSTSVPLGGSGIDRFISASPRTVDFGTLKMGRSESRTLSIFNDGDMPLTLFSAGIGGRHAADFRLIQQPTRTIAPGDATNVRLRFKPAAAGARAGELLVRSDACSDSTLRIPLGGLAIEPAIRVSPETLDFGNRALGKQITKRLTITNDGEDKLRIADIAFVTGAEGVYRIDGFPKRFPLVLRAHRSKTMQVVFIASRPGPLEGSLTVRSNDPDDRSIKITLYGAGIEPPSSPKPEVNEPAPRDPVGFSFPFDRYVPELAVIASVALFFAMLTLIRRVKGIPE